MDVHVESAHKTWINAIVFHDNAFICQMPLLLISSHIHLPLVSSELCQVIIYRTCSFQCTPSKNVISNMSTWGRKRVHMQLLDFSSNSGFHAQILKFCKSPRILTTAARREKTSLILTPPPPPVVEREHICNFGTFLQIQDFMPKYGNFSPYLRNCSRRHMVEQK